MSESTTIGTEELAPRSSSCMSERTLEMMKSNVSSAAKLMKALANDSRLLILCHLDGKELSVSELNRCLELSQSALSQHLAVLRKDGLVRTRRVSQTIYYSLEGDTAKRIIRTLHEMYCGPGPS